MTKFIGFIIVLLLALALYLFSVDANAARVTASAYNTVSSQTQGNPNIGACGKVNKSTIAVSRDLRKKYPCGTKVKINGKTYTVMDTMAKRWKNKIDICYGKDIRGARKFGVRKVNIERLKI